MEYNIPSVDRKHLFYGTKLCDSQGKKEKKPLFNAWIFFSPPSAFSSFGQGWER